MAGKTRSRELVCPASRLPWESPRSLLGGSAPWRPGGPLTPEFWDELEETLILADFGVPTTQKIVTGLQTVAKQEAWKTTDQVVARFRKDVERFLTLPDAELRLDREPAVVLVVGVNGSGKTTTIGKLATRLRNEGKRVLLVAADTFRAAAAEQLAIWADAQRQRDRPRRRGRRSGLGRVRRRSRAAKARSVDVVLVDTAGRLQTKTNLMEELKKMRRVIEREAGRAARRDAARARRHDRAERDLAGEALQRRDRAQRRRRHQTRLDRQGRGAGRDRRRARSSRSSSSASAKRPMTCARSCRPSSSTHCSTICAPKRQVPLTWHSWHATISAD